MKHFFRSFALVVCATLVTCWSRWTQAADFIGNQWIKAAPAEVGLNESMLSQAREFALSGGGSGMIVRSGRLAYSWGDPSKLYDLIGAKQALERIRGTKAGSRFMMLPSPGAPGQSPTKRIGGMSGPARAPASLRNGSAPTAAPCILSSLAKITSRSGAARFVCAINDLGEAKPECPRPGLRPGRGHTQLIGDWLLLRADLVPNGGFTGGDIRRDDIVSGLAGDFDFADLLPLPIHAHALINLRHGVERKIDNNKTETGID